jgi:RND family efflux transporter MFP subunit
LPNAAALTLLEAATPVLPVLFDLLERARPARPLFLVARLWSRLTRRRRQASLAGAALVAALLACPFHYSIRADCRLVPTVKRVVAAPFSGQLKTTFVRPGDRVTGGQPLAELDNRELQLKEAELNAARERALKQRDKAMSNQGEGADFAAAQLAAFEAQSVGQELELTRRRLAMLALQAPLAGVVVSGDLRRAEGQPVQQGQVLFEVAPLEEMIVEIDVPDREISRVRAGLPLRFRLEAFAGQQWDGKVERLHPRSEQREGRNVFICEAPIRNDDPRHDLRPGMRGRAVIESDRRPLLWIIGHRLWHFIVEGLLW